MIITLYITTKCNCLGMNKSHKMGGLGWVKVGRKCLPGGRSKYGIIRVQNTESDCNFTYLITSNCFNN